MSAVFSEDGVYRYVLRRRLPLNLLPSVAKERIVLFVMLNPSTADATNNDPTVRRCIGFAESWGFSDLTVCNLFALRSTDPMGLYSHEEPVGPQNDRWLAEEAEAASLVVAAWGVHGHLQGRGDAVAALLRASKPLYALGLTRVEPRQPRHPLYVRGDVEPVRWDSREG